MQQPRKADRMEQQPSEFYERVRDGYRHLAAREPNRVVLIDGSASPDVVENEIWTTISAQLPALARAAKPKTENRKSKI
jgi:dTMP kinase